MKIRFVTYAYPPLFYPRAIQISLLARMLAKDHDLDILCAGFGRQDRSLQALCADCSVVRLPQTTLARLVGRIKGDRIKRAILLDDMYLNLGAYYCHLDRQSWDGVHLVTFGQPMSMHLIGLHYKNKFPSLKWTAHFSDPWNYEGYSLHKGLSRFLNDYYEGAVYRAADSLIFTSPETVDMVLTDRHAAHAYKAHIVPHGYDESLYGDSVKTASGIDLGYFGGFYGARQPYVLFEALKVLLRSNENFLRDVRINFYGVGNQSSYMEALAGLEDIVFFHSGVGYQDSLALCKKMDGLLVIDAPADVSPFFPSKLADYIGADRPILGITPHGASARILCDLGMKTTDPSSVLDVAEGLRRFISDLRIGVLALRKVERQQYDSERVAQVFMRSMA